MIGPPVSTSTWKEVSSCAKFPAASLQVINVS